MILLILGFVAMIAAGAITRSDARLRPLRGPIRAAGAAIMLIGVLMSCIKQINAGEIGVKKLFGKVQKDVWAAGFILSIRCFR